MTNIYFKRNNIKENKDQVISHEGRRIKLRRRSSSLLSSSSSSPLQGFTSSGAVRVQIRFLSQTDGSLARSGTQTLVVVRRGVVDAAVVPDCWRTIRQYQSNQTCKSFS